jgi:hypothetical protein
MPIYSHREKGVQWWLRFGKIVITGKNLKKAKLLFSERKGCKPSISLFGWRVFIERSDFY